MQYIYQNYFCIYYNIEYISSAFFMTKTVMKKAHTYRIVLNDDKFPLYNIGIAKEDSTTMLLVFFFVQFKIKKSTE